MSANASQPRSPLSLLVLSLCENGWVAATDLKLESCVEQLVTSHHSSACLLQFLSTSECGLSTAATRILHQVADSGISLLAGWPRAWGASIDDWIGPRFYFSTSRNLSTAQQYFSLTSSQIGRHGNKQPNWPAFVDAALQFSHRDHLRPLIVPGTSLSDATMQFSDRAELDSLTIECDTRRTVEEWLSDLLSKLEAACETDSLETFAASLASRLLISPPLVAPHESAISVLPLQDRFAIAIADRVFAIHVRRGGTISQLLSARLADHRFPTASVFVASLLEPSTPLHEFQQWLDRGAVGWLLPKPPQQFYSAFACSTATSESPHVQSLVLPLRAIYNPSRNSLRGLQQDWPYLAHCTRGNAGPLPEESMERYIDRVWSRGSVPESNAFATLAQILEQQRVAGNTRMTRSESRCVSFSAVPLAELLSRRQFRSHLGRWDWEPYGVLVRRDALESLGARPVIYGDEVDFKQLNEDDQDFFQPRYTKTTRKLEDWSIEQEWRLRGDLNFRDLPIESVLIFAASRSQADQIARHVPWPVLSINER